MLLCTAAVLMSLDTSKVVVKTDPSGGLNAGHMVVQSRDEALSTATGDLVQWIAQIRSLETNNTA